MFGNSKVSCISAIRWQIANRIYLGTNSEACRGEWQNVSLPVAGTVLSRKLACWSPTHPLATCHLASDSPSCRFFDATPDQMRQFATFLQQHQQLTTRKSACWNVSTPWLRQLGRGRTLPANPGWSPDTTQSWGGKIAGMQRWYDGRVQVFKSRCCRCASRRPEQPHSVPPRNHPTPISLLSPWPSTQGKRHSLWGFGGSVGKKRLFTTVSALTSRWPSPRSTSGSCPPSHTTRPTGIWYGCTTCTTCVILGNWLIILETFWTCQFEYNFSSKPPSCEYDFQTGLAELHSTQSLTQRLLH